ncbi:Amidase enhancer precursor [Paenibacillus sp. P1XP2]|nr:Amidase enhancer precursor [Paenibacillus sp. P1XP2]
MGPAASRARPRQSLAAAGTGQRPQAPPRRHVGGRAADAGAAHPGACGGNAPKAGSRAAPIPAPAAPVVPQQTAQPQVSVYLTKTGQVEKLSLEDYVVGVVAAEMPAEFDLEALKAQAVAARTFIVRRLADGDKSGVPGLQADVTDTVATRLTFPRPSWRPNGRKNPRSWRS